jgi:membrane associated rhomboid family serine protease
MKRLDLLVYVSVFAAIYILFGLASGRTTFSRFDVAGMAAGCIGGELGMLYMRHRTKRQAS